MDDRSNIKKLLILAVIAGRIMLKNGAETYRVEDTLLRICKSRMNIKYAESFVTTTGIFLTVEYKDEVISYVYRIKSRTIDLNKVSLVNDFSRKFVNSNMSIDEGEKLLKNIEKSKTYSRFMKLFFGGFTGGFFSVLFGGGLSDFISAFIVSVLVVYIINSISKFDFAFFLKNILGGITAAFFSIAFFHLGLGNNLDTIIISSIMPLVPGVAITNAIRDTISEDFLSGMSRGVEALVIALSVAFGVGIVLRFYFLYFGGI